MKKTEKKHKEKAKSFFKDFKAFINRGNVVNLAIAIIIGGSFGKIVTSLVNDIITPFIAAAFGGDNFGDFRWILRQGVTDADGAVVTAEIAVRYGEFIMTILDFLIVAFFIFLAFRLITRAGASIKKAIKARNCETAPAEAATLPEPQKPTQEELLTQIRDLLAEGRRSENHSSP